MFLFSHCNKMMQIGLIHCRRFSVCFPCSLIWFVCIFFFLTFSFTSASSGSLTAWLDIYSSQTLIRPTWPPLVSHHYFPSLSAIFSMPALFQFFPHLLIFSAPLSLFVHHLSVFWKCSLFSFCLYSHCFTTPWAKQVFCSSHSVSLETLFENSDVSFKHVLWGLLNVLPHRANGSLLTHFLCFTIVTCFMNLATCK